MRRRFDRARQLATLGCLLAILLVVSAGCDGLLRARVKVVSVEGRAIPDALISHERSVGHELAKFTDANGCASLTGVVAPVRHVGLAIGKPGHKTQLTRLRTKRDNCLIVRLAADDETAMGTIETAPSESCPCETDTGYTPTMSARFKVTDIIENDIALVAVRRSDLLPSPWVQVTDDTGCVGIRWRVSPHLRSVSLVLEKAGFDPAHVEVPTMADPCYSVRLWPSLAFNRSTVTAIADINCGCEMFSGKTIWPESSPGEP
jgi:hypothetical protein